MAEYQRAKGNLHGPGKLRLRGGTKIAEVEQGHDQGGPGKPVDR